MSDADVAHLAEPPCVAISAPAVTPGRRAGLQLQKMERRARPHSGAEASIWPGPRAAEEVLALFSKQLHQLLFSLPGRSRSLKPKPYIKQIDHPPATAKTSRITSAASIAGAGGSSPTSRSSTAETDERDCFAARRNGARQDCRRRVSGRNRACCERSENRAARERNHARSSTAPHLAQAAGMFSVSSTASAGRRDRLRTPAHAATGAGYSHAQRGRCRSPRTPSSGSRRDRVA